MPSVQLHANKFEELIFRRGRDVFWQQAVVCSCWNLQTGQPLYTCNACGGTGYTYQPPLIGRALVTSISQSKQFNEFAGTFEAGDAVMTVPARKVRLVNKRISSLRDIEPLFQVSVYDLITLTDDVRKFSEVLIKNTSIPNRAADTLLNINPLKVHYVQSADTVTGIITPYEEGIDFQMVGNKVEWLTDKLADGQSYGIMYDHRPVYTVLTELPQQRHQDGQDLPKRVVLRFKSGGFGRVDV